MGKHTILLLFTSEKNYFNNFMDLFIDLNSEYPKNIVNSMKIFGRINDTNVVFIVFDKCYDIVYSELILKHSLMGTIRKDQHVTGVTIVSDFHNIVDNILSY